MQTTVELPDQVLEKLNALAEARGCSVDEVIAQAIERVIGKANPPVSKERINPPIIHLKHTKRLDLSGFDFDDLLA